MSFIHLNLSNKRDEQGVRDEELELRPSGRRYRAPPAKRKIYEGSIILNTVNHTPDGLQGDGMDAVHMYDHNVCSVGVYL